MSVGSRARSQADPTTIQGENLAFLFLLDIKEPEIRHQDIAIVTAVALVHGLYQLLR